MEKRVSGSNRFLAALLAIALLIGCVPMGIHAEDESPVTEATQEEVVSLVAKIEREENVKPEASGEEQETPEQAEEGEAADYYTVAVLNSDGTVSDNSSISGTAAVTVTPGVTTYEWVEAGTERPADGWYVGIRVTAPESGVAEGATFQTRTTGDWSAEYGLEDEVGDNGYIDLWYYLDAARLYTAKVNGALGYGVKLNWTEDGTAREQVISLEVDPANVTLLDSDGATVYPVSNIGGAVSVLNSDGTVNTEGTITGSGTDFVSVTPAAAIYEKLEATGDRPVDGYWAGVRIDLPENYSADSATYQIRKGQAAWTDAQKVGEALESDGENQYITLWKNLNDLADGKELAATQMQFDWDGNGTYDQCVELAIDSSNVTLMDGSKQVYPYVPYTYTVNVYENDVVVDDLSKVTVAWANEQVTGSNVLNTDQESVQVKVTYNGIEFTLDSDNSSEVTFGVTDNEWAKSGLQVGIPFDLPANTLVGNVALVGADQYAVEYSENLLTAENDKLYAAAEGTVTVTETWRGADGKIYAVRENSAEVSYPEATITINGADISSGWYTDAQTVTVTIAGAADAVTEYLPEVKVYDAVSQASWTVKDNDLVMTLEGISTSTTIIYGEGTDVENKAELKVDTVKPTVAVKKIYRYDGKLYVTYEYNVGESGLSKVTIDGGDVDFGEVTENTGTLSVVLDDTNIDPTKVVITNGAGVSSDIAEAYAQPDLRITFSETNVNVLGEYEGNDYVSKDSKLTIKVTGAAENTDYAIKPENFQIIAKDQAQNPISVTWSETEAYTAEISLGNGLSELSVSVKDETGRTEENTYSKTYFVDNDAPVITVDGLDAIAAGTKQYSDKEVTITVTLTDILPEDYTSEDANSKVTYILNGKPVTGQFKDGKFELELTDGAMLSDLVIEACDKTGNQAESVTLIPEDSYLIVDRTAPTAKLTFSENVKGFYYGEDGTIFVILYQPVEGESGAVIGANETVTVTVEVNDKNLALGNGVEANRDWIGTPAVNADSKITYVASSGEISADGTCVIEIDVSVVDLAGNKLKSFTSVATGDGQTIDIDVDENGHFSFNVSVDRRRPTSENEDTTVPTITVSPSLNPSKTSKEQGELDLFKGQFYFDVKITDGESGRKNSGVKNVKWSISDENGVVLDQNNGEGSLSSNGTYIIPVGLTDEAKANGGESNKVTLTITAVDNVGNTITYTKVFGVDTLAPRVSITQSNQDVKNGCYFDKEQIITVEIEDLNFDPNNSSVDTQVNSNGWKLVENNTYQTVLTYDQNGTYTFAMATTDLAGNQGTIDYETNLVALKKFILDVTGPVAEVTFSENVKDIYIGEDGTIFVILAEPAEGDSGTSADQIDQEVTVTVNLTDFNLSEELLTSGWNGNVYENAESTVSFDVVTEKVAPDGTYVIEIPFGAVDLAGNKLESVTTAGYTNTWNGSVKDGNVTFNVSVDRRRPTSGDAETTPIIVPVPSLNPSKTSEEQGALDLFNGAFVFDVTITDGVASNLNSGVKNVKWSISDKNGVVVSQDNGKGTVSSNGTYSIPVELTEEAKANGGESNEVTLTITAVDNVGNTITYEKVFGVDTLAPRVTITQSNQDVKSGSYFDNDQEITVEIKDLNFDRDNSSVDTQVNFNGWTPVEGKNNTYQTVLTYDVDGDYTFGMASTDRAANEAVIDYDTNLVSLESFTIDKTDPVVKVQITYQDAEPNTLDRADADDIDYYSGEVKFDIAVTDVNLDAFEDGLAEAYFRYKLAESDEWVEVNLVNQFDVSSREAETATAAVTVANGDLLTDFEIVVVDNAGRKPAAINVSAVDGEGNVLADPAGFVYNEEGKWVYTGNDIAVDIDAPVIKVEKTVVQDAKLVQTYENVDYYNGSVTYTVTVTDKFLLDGAGVANLVINYQNLTKQIDLLTDENVTVEHTKTDSSTGKSYTTDTYVYTFVVEDVEDAEEILEMLKGITLEVKDNAGNVVTQNADNLTVSENETGHTKFTYDGNTEKWSYSGNPVVVDTTAPTATLTFSENVKDFYVDQAGTVYAILGTPVTGESGVGTGMADETVTVTVKASDKNLALGNGVSANEKYGFGWTGSPVVNGDSTVTFVASSSNVNADGTRVFVIDLDVVDLAGNALTNFWSDPTSDNKTLEIGVSNGHVGFETSVDRRRPTSEADDTTAPTITITPSVTPNKTSEEQGSLDLFSGEFQFRLHVTDGAASNLNSGVKYVKWTITDENGVVAAVDSGELISTDGSYVINVDLAQALGESNAVKLNIVAVDNVGNTVTFEKVFGVDTLAPRVTITQSNHSVQNERYFKDDQVVTVEVEDLNFEPTTSSAMPVELFTGWQSVGGNTYRTVLTYNVDGDYTFSMASTDRAINDATIDYTTNLVSLQSFTIDKTAPVISVSYSPASPVDVDGNGVQYFDADRTVYVTINERNFNAADVRANLGSSNALTQWSNDNGDIHNASDTFREGNGYHVAVEYTDLAGNPAVSYSSPTFSVDKTAPVIEMSKGSMKFGELNPVSGDLELGFTITDHQDNLKDVVVELVFVGRDFHQSVSSYYTLSDENRSTRTVNLDNIVKDRDTDGIYTLRITAYDYAGHAVPLQSDLVFSLNRFGSTFTVDDSYTAGILTVSDDGVSYRNEIAQDLVIKEINPNRVWQDAEHTVEGSIITVSVNGNSVTLEKGVDYEITCQEKGTGAEKWYEYTYSIKPDVFSKNGELVDGDYTIYFYSEDEAGNQNANESNAGSELQLGQDGTYSGKASFTLDHQKPVISILGIQEDERYFEAYRTVEISISDNTTVQMKVYVNDVLVESLETGESKSLDSDWVVYDKTTGTYKLNLSQKKDQQNVRVEVVDAAGNESTATVGSIMLNENLWYQYINSPLALVLTGVILLALVILIILLVTKRKKKAEKTENTANQA